MTINSESLTDTRGIFFLISESCLYTFSFLLKPWITGSPAYHRSHGYSTGQQGSAIGDSQKLKKLLKRKKSTLKFFPDPFAYDLTPSMSGAFLLCSQFSEASLIRHGMEVCLVCMSFHLMSCLCFHALGSLVGPTGRSCIGLNNFVSILLKSCCLNKVKHS